MKLALIGIGQTDSKAVDALVNYERRMKTGPVVSAITVNSAHVDLRELRTVPESRQMLVSLTRVKGHGVDAGNELGTEVVVEDVGEVLPMVDDLSVREVDAFPVVAGFSGGTSSGDAPAIVRELKHICIESVCRPGILSTRDESDIHTLSTACSFQVFIRKVDNLIVFNNNA